ncbi:CPCC family cysteine-rich protein [Streptomyces sp. NPDC048720]|uniref:CPCC family cysteine-rich protein n=1 Tax=Streptomyces sp. NPDC048720 TaxID=3365588 RepID=UPI003721D7E7
MQPRTNDGQDEHDASEVHGGPNHSLSFRQARQNFDVFGACDERSAQFARAPLLEEHLTAAHATESAPSTRDPDSSILGRTTRAPDRAGNRGERRRAERSLRSAPRTPAPSTTN